MTNKIWIVSKFSRIEEWTDIVAVFPTEKDAEEYVDKMKTDLCEKIIPLWEKRRPYCEVEDSIDSDEIEYTSEEQEFINLTGYEPWDFCSEYAVELEFDTYTISSAPFYQNVKEIFYGT